MFQLFQFCWHFIFSKVIAWTTTYYPSVSLINVVKKSDTWDYHKPVAANGIQNTSSSTKGMFVYTEGLTYHNSQSIIKVWQEYNKDTRKIYDCQWRRIQNRLARRLQTNSLQVQTESKAGEISML